MVTYSTFKRAPATISNKPFPTVSVVLAVRDEFDTIAAALDSLVSQEFETCKLELLVVDGGSTDGSLRIIREYCERYPHVYLVNNPEHTTPYAFNHGLARASGEYVGIFGAHAVYKPNYVQICLDSLLKKNASACSGRVLVTPDTNDAQSRTVAYMMSLPFTCSSSSYRSAQPGFVPSVPYAIFRKEALQELGGYDVALTRNQDNDMNHRLREAGHRLYLTFDTESYYKPNLSIAGSLRYSFNSGAWNMYTLGKCPMVMRWYHFVPLLFVCTLVALLLGGILFGVTGFSSLVTVVVTLLYSLLILHLIVGSLAVALHDDSKTRWEISSCGYLAIPFLALAFHISYGAGSLVALLRGRWMAGRRDRLCGSSVTSIKR